MEQPYSEVRKRLVITIGNLISRWSKRTSCILGEKKIGSDFRKTEIGKVRNGGL